MNRFSLFIDYRKQFMAVICILLIIAPIYGCFVYTPDTNIDITNKRKIPLKVAVVLDEKLINNVYSNSYQPDWGKGENIRFELNVGKSTADVLKKGLPLIFDSVDFISSDSQIKDHQAIIYPEIKSSNAGDTLVADSKNRWAKKNYRSSAKIELELRIVSRLQQYSFQFNASQEVYKVDATSGSSGYFSRLMGEAESRAFMSIAQRIQTSLPLAGFVEGMKSLELTANNNHKKLDEMLVNSVILFYRPDLDTGKLTKFAGDPFVTIQRLIQEKVDKYMAPDTPVDVNSQVPPEVSKLELPILPTLVKSEFESKIDFEEKVKKAKEEREISIVQLQEEYRKKVENRNRAVEELSQTYALDIERIKKKQQEKKNNLQSRIKQYMREAFFEVMGAAVMETPVYDAETEIMYVDLKAVNSDYKKRIALHVPRTVAKSFHSNISSVAPMAIFSIEDDGIKLKDIKALYDGITYQALLTDKEYRPEKIEVALKDTKVGFKAGNQMNLKLQNPNLIDTYRVSSISYGESASASGRNFTDDLKPLIASYQQKAFDPKKWLFMIAIEHYNETDPVTFAKSSAEAFRDTAQKAFGIDAQHTYALIDDQATSAAISIKLDYLLNVLVKEGDTIYFYYSGHGVPDNKTSESFILPKDAIADYVAKDDQFQLTRIYKRMTDSRAGKIIAFVDACFSGRTDAGQLFKGTAAAYSRTKKLSFDESKMAILTAAKDDQFANAYDDKGHRMFSYFVVKGLLSGRDNLDSLYKEVSLNVHDLSKLKGQARLQDPQMYGNKNIGL